MAPTDDKEQPCAKCARSANMRCSRCLLVRYCSKECQRSHWLSHKAKCKLMKDDETQQLHHGGKEEGPCAQCGHPSPYKCAHCRKSYYCKKACQQQHWQAHKSQCYPFQVAECSELGRYVVATRPLRTGEVLLKEDPLILSPFEPLSAPCLGCLKPLDGSYRCRQCGWPLCGPGCEESTLHQPECRLSKPLQKNVHCLGKEAYKVIYLLKCLALKSNEEKYARLLNMQSHTEERKANFKKNQNEKDVLGAFKKTLEKRYNSSGNGDTLESFVQHMMGIIDVNGFEISSGDIDAMGLFPTAAMMEHSCTPNTKHKFSNSHQLILKAAVDIAEDEHISATYTKILWGTVARRKDLLKHKYFLCSCKRCSDPTEFGTYFSALKCDKCKEGYLLQESSLDTNTKWICNLCKDSITTSEAENRTTSLGDDMERVMTNPEKSSLEKLISESVATKAHYNHFHLFKARHTLMQLYGRGPDGLKDDALKKKETLCQEFLDICALFDPGDSRLAPYTGVALYEMHDAVIIRAQRLACREYPDQNKVDQCMDAAKALLQRCIKVLQDEPETQPGGKLRIIAQRKLTELGLLTAKYDKK